ncbi:MAG: class I SAM-dependent methyltransferase [Candidatus Latescibacterota bacterium]|jgi:SAM-dependent methyltransferase
MAGSVPRRAATAAPADYLTHYRLDAEAILDPRDLEPQQRASEARRIEALVRMLAPSAGERMMDLGCGSGWLAARCRRTGAEVHAVDLSPRGVAAARRRFPEVDRFHVADVYRLPFQPASFDALVLSEVLEHLTEPVQALVEVRRVLLPGGRLLICVPYRERILQHLCIHCNRLTPANAHLHSFAEADLAAALEEAGLRVRRFAFLANKALALVGFPRWSRSWPHGCWQLCDRLANRLLRKPAFVAVLAVRPD